MRAGREKGVRAGAVAPTPVKSVKSVVGPYQPKSMPVVCGSTRATFLQVFFGKVHAVRWETPPAGWDGA